MNCQDARLLIKVCQPDEPDLGGPEFGGLREHVAQCPQCASALDETTEFDEKLSRMMRSVATPAGLEQRILAQLAAASKPRRTGWRWAAAAAVAAAVCLGAYTGWPTPAPRWTLAQAVAVIADLAPDAPEATLPGKPPLLPQHLPNPQSYQYVRRSLAGHSVDMLRCWFDPRQAPIAEVYLIPSDWLVEPIGNAPEFVYFSDSAAGLRVMAWREGGHTFLLVSRRPEAELQQWFGDTAQWT